MKKSQGEREMTPFLSEKGVECFGNIHTCTHVHTRKRGHWGRDLKVSDMYGQCMMDWKIPHE